MERAADARGARSRDRWPPAALLSKDTHTLWLNSAAGGEGDGILRETDAWRFREQHLRPDAEETVDAMRRAQKLVAARGVTSIHDFDGGRGALELWQRLRAQTQLTLRVWQTQPHDRSDVLAALGLRSGFGDPFPAARTLEGLYGRRAGLGDGGDARRLGCRPDDARRARRDRHARGRGRLPVAVHAIGDRANRDALDALEATHETWAPAGLRPRIEHAQCLAPEDLARFAELGVAVSVQFAHATSDRDSADAAWPAHEGAYAYGALAESGALLVNGSDAPVEEVDPGGRACARRSAAPRTSARPGIP